MTVRLPYREPLHVTALLEFLAARAVPGVEEVDATGYRRALRLPYGTATVTLVPAPGQVTATLRLADLRDLAPAVARCRRLLDLDADPVAADGDTVLPAGGTGLRPFPGPHQIAGAPDDALPMPAARRATVRALAAAVASGDLVLDEGADRAGTIAALRAVPGIGDWTAGYLAMRALGDPDVFLPTDLGVRRGAARLGLPDRPAALDEHARHWRPWRSYAVARLWRS